MIFEIPRKLFSLFSSHLLKIAKILIEIELVSL